MFKTIAFVVFNPTNIAAGGGSHRPGTIWVKCIGTLWLKTCTGILSYCHCGNHVFMVNHGKSGHNMLIVKNNHCNMLIIL
jgi:hypothetical protein